MRRTTYREKFDRKKAGLAAAGLVSERHAEVENVEFRMTYYRRGVDPVLMTRTLSFRPCDHAGFHLSCMEDGCMNGGFDLAPVVAAMVKGRRTSASGRLFCRGTSDTIGHASIAYEVNIRYL